MAHGEPRGRSVGPPVRRVDALSAVATVVVAFGLLIGLPLLDGIDTDSLGVVYPAVGGLAWSAVAVGLLVQSAVLVLAGRAPRTTMLIVAAIPVVVALLASSTLHGLTALPIVVAVVLAAVRVPIARLWPSLLVTAGLVLLGQTIVALTLPAGTAGRATGVASALGAGALQAVGAVGIPLVIALIVQSRREVRRAREAEAQAVEREADARVDAALARSRATMARELHDIAAHHLSGIALMAAAIDRQIDTDPQRAHEGIRQAREQTTAVLDDLRRLVGLLREDGAAQRAVETLDGLPDLVDRARLRGPVEFRVLAGAGRPLGQGVGPLSQLTGYRTVQEALANAAMHAPGALATVLVDDRDDGAVSITVQNGAGTGPADRPASSGGYGLLGMRERADLVGATLQYGRTENGGWRVALTLHRDDVRAVDDTATEPQGES